MPTDRARAWAAVLDVLARSRESEELTPTYVADYHGLDEDVVEEAMREMAAVDVLDLTHDHDIYGPTFENAETEPSECDWCGAPFPEAGRHSVTQYDPDGEPYDSFDICSACIRDRF
jgi:hypothetical protein